MQVRVIRGRAADLNADRTVTATMLEWTAETDRPAVRVWQPHRQVAFGRRDTHAEGYETARQAGIERGFAPVERRVGGRAVAYTDRTLAFAYTVPIEDVRTGTCDRYGVASETLIEALRDLGCDVVRGEPEAAYCPGSHSVSGVDNEREPTGKIAGLAQRVRSGAAMVSGCLTVAETDEAELRAVLQPVYQALGIDFDPDSVGSVSAAGGPDDPEQVARRLEDALVGRNTPAVKSVGDLREMTK